MADHSPTVEITAHGRPALRALHAAVRVAKRDDPLSAVTVVVPSNFVGLATRRALASGDLGPVIGDRPGMAGVTFLTLYRLAELLGANDLAAEGRRPVSTPVIAAAVRRALSDEPGRFARVAEHPTTERRLVQAHRELSDLDDTRLDVLAGLSAAASEVVRLHRAVKTLLAGDWYMEQDLLESARHRVASDAGVVAPLGAVIVHLPERFTPARSALLTTVGRSVPTTIVAALTGHADADAAVVDGLRSLGVVPADPAPPPVSLPAFDITTVSDADDEVRHVVRGIVAAAREGVAFDRMAVLWGTPQPYLRLLHDHLGAAGIPLNGAAVTTLAESTAGRVLQRLLALPDRNYRREDVIGLMSSAPIRWRGTPVPSRAWDQISRDAGVVKGMDDWDRRLGRYIADARNDIEAMGDDPEYEWRVHRLTRSAELAEQLQAFMADLAASLARGAAVTSWRDRARWCGRLLRGHLASQQTWPDHERRAAERVDAALDRLATLDAVESRSDLQVFRRTLDLELDGGLGRTGSFGNGVLIGPASVATGMQLDRVWVVGMSEGSFPARMREDSLLPDRERRDVGVLTLRADRTGDEHRAFLAAVAAVSASGRLHLLHPRGDLRQSNERAPSRWLMDMVHQCTGDATVSGADLDALDQPWMHHVPSFAAGIMSSAFPATQQEYELQSLAAEARRAGTVSGHELLHAVPALGAGATLQDERGSTRFTRFDGNLGGLGVRPPGTEDRAGSATALETWARCPHQFLVRYLLGVNPLETPELRVRIDPLSKGALLHRILETFVQGEIDAGRTGPVRWTEGDRARLHEIADAEFAAAEARGLTGEALYWRRDQVLMRRDLDAFLDTDNERRRERGLVPVATELGFGLRGAEPVALDVPDHPPVRIRGSIDLVDETPEGDLVVIDYKTGRYQSMSADEPHKAGTKLQLVLYAIAARDVLGRPDAAVESWYWHLRPDAGYRTAGYEVTPAVEGAVLGAVATIVDGIAAGVFPMHPDESTRTQWVSCPFCDPDGLGVSEARRRFERMVADPALAGYVGLAEPNLVPSPRLDLADDHE